MHLLKYIELRLPAHLGIWLTKKGIVYISYNINPLSIRQERLSECNARHPYDNRHGSPIHVSEPI